MIKLYGVGVFDTSTGELTGYAHSGSSYTPSVYDNISQAKSMVTRRNNSAMVGVTYKVVELIPCPTFLKN